MNSYERLNMNTAFPVAYRGRVAETSARGRRTAVEGPIPGATMRRLGRSGASQGQLPANNRPAVPARERQCGGQPNRCPPADRREFEARPPLPHMRPSSTATTPPGRIQEALAGFLNHGGFDR